MNLGFYTATPDPCVQRELSDMLLDAEGIYSAIVPAEMLLQYPQEQLCIWGNLHQVFQYATIELVDWIAERIVGRAIEIGAGLSPIGVAIGIKQTDAANPSPELLMRYAMLGVRHRLPPPRVERLEALEAVEKYRPSTVLACWVTEKGLVGKTNYRGIDEKLLLRCVHRYILVGNISTHGEKSILKQPHSVHSYPWIVSRSRYKDQNRIWVWPPLESEPSTPGE